MNKHVCIFILLIFIPTSLLLGSSLQRIAKLEEAKSPYNKAIQIDTLLKVLVLMGQKYDPRTPWPEIRNANNVSQEEYNRAIGFDTQGRFCPLYDYINNVIYLLEDSQVHTLAHEYAHYVQVRYEEADLEIGPLDTYEIEAITIQNYFRN